MNIIIFGPQASGKGTQARLIAQEFSLFHIENGKVLREMAKTNERIRNMIANGILVPDLEMLAIMEEHLLKNHGRFDDIVFDGYPRTVSQYEALKKWLSSKGQKVDFAVYLTLSDEEAVRRLSARRIHKVTGEIYNLVTNPPVDVDERDLVQREDDKPEAILRRLKLFRDESAKIVGFYEQDGILIQINGEQSIEAISQEIFNKLRQNLKEDQLPINS